MEPFAPHADTSRIVVTMLLASWQAGAYAALACAYKAIAASNDTLVVATLLIAFGVGAAAAALVPLVDGLATALAAAGLAASAGAFVLIVARPPWRLLVAAPCHARALGVTLHVQAGILAGLALFVVGAARGLEATTAVAAGGAWAALIAGLALAPGWAIVATAVAVGADWGLATVLPTAPAGVCAIVVAAVAVLTLARREDAPA